MGDPLALPYLQGLQVSHLAKGNMLTTFVFKNDYTFPENLSRGATMGAPLVNYCTGQRNPTSAQNILKNILRSNCVAGIKILTNTIDPELNSASIVFFGFSSTLFSKN